MPEWWNRRLHAKYKQMVYGTRRARHKEQGRSLGRVFGCIKGLWMGRADKRRGGSRAGWGDGAERCEITSMRVSRWDAAGTAYRAADYGKAGMASESFADGIRSC